MEVRAVKKFESGVVKDPITVTPKTTVQEVKQITQANNISGLPVVDGKDLDLIAVIRQRSSKTDDHFIWPVRIDTDETRLDHNIRHAVKCVVEAIPSDSNPIQGRGIDLL